MRETRRIAIWAACGWLAASVLAGCGGSSNDDEVDGIAPDDVRGRWVVWNTEGDDVFPPTATHWYLEQTGDRVSIDDLLDEDNEALERAPRLEATISGSRLQARTNTGANVHGATAFVVDGTVEEDTITGTFGLDTRPKIPFQARRIETADGAAARSAGRSAATDAADVAATLDDHLRRAGSSGNGQFPVGYPLSASPTVDATSLVDWGEYNCEQDSESLQQSFLIQNVPILQANPDDTVYYPGALLDGKTLKDLGRPQDFLAGTGVTRGGGRLLVGTLVTLGPGAPTAYDFDRYGADTSREAVEGFKNNIMTSAASFTFKSHTSYSAQQALIQMGAGVQVPNIASLDVNFEFSDTTKKTFLVAELRQPYMTVYFPYPDNNRPSGFLDPAQYPTVSDLPAALTDKLATSPMLYMSSVTYGRTVLLFASSDYSEIELEAAMKGAASAEGATIKASTGASYSDILANANVEYYVYGGSQATLQVLDPQAGQSVYDRLVQVLAQYKEGDGSHTFDPAIHGIPIAYSANYVADGSPVILDGSFGYNVLDNCQKSPPPTPAPSTTKEYNFHVSLSYIDDDIYACVNGNQTQHFNPGNNTKNFHFEVCDGHSDCTPTENILLLTLGNGGCGPTSETVKIYQETITTVGDNPATTKMKRVYKYTTEDTTAWDCGWQRQQVVRFRTDKETTPHVSLHKGDAQLWGNVGQIIGVCDTE